MNKATGKASSLISGLKSSFSSGSGFSLGGRKNPQPDPVSSDDQAQQVVDNIQEPVSPQINQQEQLDTLEQVIGQVESERGQTDQESLGTVAQVIPQTVDQINDPLNPPNPTPVGSTKKEAYVVGSSVATENLSQSVEHPGGIQTVEQERTPEITPEVESFLQQAQEQSDHLPQEIVVADNQAVSSTTHHPKKPVVVLPISPKEQSEGKKKSPKLSIRWLVEWSVKIMKKFSGEVIYREEE